MTVSPISHKQINGKVPLLCERLRAMATEHDAHRKLPTVQELCTLFGTSRATLNDALAQVEAEGIVYRKPGSGIYVAPRTTTICILIGTHVLETSGASPFWGALLALFARQAQLRAQQYNEEHSLHLLVHTPGQRFPLPKELVHAMQMRHVQGTLLIGVDEAVVQWIEQQGIPAVSFACWGQYTVGLDEVEFLRLAIACLARQGCRQIGVWAAVPSYYSPSDRPALRTYYERYMRYFLADHGLAFDPQLLRILLDERERSLDVDNSQEYGYQIAYDVFREGASARPDGVVIVRDVLTNGVLAALKDLNVHIGKDVKIASHANVGSRFLHEGREQLTIIEYDPAQVVQSMFSLLDTLLMNKCPTPAAISIPPHLRSKAEDEDTGSLSYI